MLGSIPLPIKYQYLFSIVCEFCIYHGTGGNGWDVTKGTLALLKSGVILKETCTVMLCVTNDVVNRSEKTDLPVNASCNKTCNNTFVCFLTIYL